MRMSRRQPMAHQLVMFLPLLSCLVLLPILAYAGGNRPVVMGVRGMVAAHHPLAAQAGIEILKKGSTAVDAAIAANAYSAWSTPR